MKNHKKINNVKNYKNTKINNLRNKNIYNLNMEGLPKAKYAYQGQSQDEIIKKKNIQYKRHRDRER